MIDSFFTKLFTVARISWSGDSGGEISVGSFYGHLQQSNANLTISLANTITLTHIVWCPIDTDVKAGDRIGDDTAYYSVKQIIEHRTGENTHLELYVERQEDYASV